MSYGYRVIMTEMVRELVPETIHVAFNTGLVVAELMERKDTIAARRVLNQLTIYETGIIDFTKEELIDFYDDEQQVN